MRDAHVVCSDAAAPQVMQAGNALPLALGIQRDVIDSSGVSDAPSSGCGAAVRFADKNGRDAEVTVLVLRYLRDAGFHDAYKALVNDSGISLDQVRAQLHREGAKNSMEHTARAGPFECPPTPPPLPPHSWMHPTTSTCLE